MSSTDASPIRVLHVDDDADLAEVVRIQLGRVDDDIDVVTETSASDGLDRLARGGETVDCVVSDHDMPGMDGLEFLRAVREREGDLPFILFTGKGSEEIASEAISAGVTEYLQKATGSEQYAVLAHRIRRAVAQRRDRRALEESERMFSTLVGNLPGMVYRCRMEEGWPITFASEGCLELTGYTAEEVETGEASWGEDVVHPEDREPIWEPIEAALADDDAFEVTYRIRTKQEETRWVWERGCGVHRDGETVYLEGFITDITERRRQEAELEHARELVENVGDPMYVLDTEGEIRRVNRAMASHLGYDPDELVGEAPSKIMPEADIERSTEILRELLKSEDEEAWRTWEMKMIRTDGERVPSETKTTLIYDEDGDVAGSVGVIRDVSDRKERTEELERYETVTEAVGDPVYGLDEDGVFTFVNEAMEALTGYAPEAVVGQHVSTLVRDEDVERGREHIEKLLEEPDRRAVKYEIELQTRAGESIPCEVHIALLPADEDGSFRGTAGIVRNIEARKRREDRLSEFASVVSHDLRNPLHVIQARSELARETGDLEHVEEIAAAADSMETMIADLLELARQGEAVGETRLVELETVVREAWATVATGDSELTVDEVGTVDADPDRLRSLLENLIRNAVEHGSTSPPSQAQEDAVEHGSTSPRSSSTREDAGRASPSEPSVADAPEDAVEHGAGGDDAAAVHVGEMDGGFFVADDGPGIPPAERDAIFERGYTTSEAGTGLGLSIVEEIARAHGWEVDVVESEGGGARFEFAT